MAIQQLLAGYGASGGGGGGGVTIWNSADKNSRIALSLGDSNMTTTVGASWSSVRAVQSRATGTGIDYGFESLITGSDVHEIIGVGKSSASIANNALPGGDVNGYGYYASNGNKYFNGGTTPFGSFLVPGDRLYTIMFSSGALRWYKIVGGVAVLQGGGDAFTGLSGTFFPMGGAATTASGIRLVTRSIAKVGAEVDWVP